MGRAFLILGAVFLAVGLVLTFRERLGPLWDFLSRLPLGRLPGDVVIEKENFRFSFPWVTCLVVSAILSLLF